MTTGSTQIPGYELIRELGAGGMANVYLAIQRSLDRKVALKVMKRNIEDLEKFEKRFLVEGRTMAKLPHRNIVAVYDIVKSADATYIAMEYLEGGTLSQKMKDGLSLAEAISVVVQIAQALQYAHDAGVVHRDLKPANIMFRDASTPVLTDFGIAKQQDAQSTRLTQTGMLVGTPTYMSPEQINAAEVDGRSDLYSLGVLFYEMLSGEPPFVADTPIAVLMAHLTTAPPPLEPPFTEFQPVIDRMLAKDREQRYADMKEFTRALKQTVVNNQMLWHRLQADPNQSSSEQLRALGFSISGSGDVPPPMISQQIRLPPSGRGTPRTPTPQPTGGLGRAQAALPQSAADAPVRGLPWPMLAAGAIGVIVVAVVVFMLLPERGLDPDIQKRADTAITFVNEKLAAGSLDDARAGLALIPDEAADYAGTLSVRKAVVDAYVQRIDAALTEGQLDRATELVLAAQLIERADPGLAERLDRIQAAQQRAASEARIAGLLARADEASKRGADLGPTGAYAVLMQARADAPDDARVKAALDALLARVLGPGTAAIARGDLAAARRVVDETEGQLAAEPAWQQLETELDAAVARAEQRARLDAVLARLDAQVRAGRYEAPAGDNAQETLLEAQNIARDDPAVVQRRDALARAIVARAQRALEGGRVEQALTDATLALAVKPGDAAADQLKRTAEGRIDSQRARVIAALSAAQQALAEGRYVTGGERSAKSLLEAVLALDPANADARNLLAQLPARVATAVRDRIGAGELDAAQAQLKDARAAYPQDATLAALERDVVGAVNTARAAAERRTQLERITQKLARRPFDAGTAGAVAREIAALLAANPRDVDAVTLRQRLFDALDDAVMGATSANAADAIATATTAVRQAFPGDTTAATALDRVTTNLATARARIAAAEQERLAASAGDLVLNALPWGTVEAVVDARRNPVALPEDRSTPLRLRVPAGVYTITFRHPNASRPVTQVATVQAQRAATATASFGASVTRQGYLDRAGL
jgi:serine/threonine protein kinase